MHRITSSRNPRIKNAYRLRSNRARKKTGLTIVDGIRELTGALNANVEIVELFISECSDSPEVIALQDQATRAGADLFEVDSRLFERITFGDRSEGAVGVLRVSRRGVNDLQLPAKPLIVVLDDIEKPGNLGAIVRSADAAGADAVIVSNPRTDLFHPNAIRASMGTVFSIPIAEAGRAETIEWLQDQGCNVFVSRVEATRVYSDSRFLESSAIVLGNESQGLSDEWDRPDFCGVRLPMLGAADSLNVSTTAAILLYEARRQRNSTGMPGNPAIPP